MNGSLTDPEQNTGIYSRMRGGLMMALLLVAMMGLSGCHHIFPFLKHDHGKHKGQYKQSRAQSRELSDREVAHIVFDTATRHIIEDYFHHHPGYIRTVDTSYAGGGHKGKGKGKARACRRG